MDDGRRFADPAVGYPLGDALFEGIRVIANPVIRKVVQVEYSVVRTPLAVLERRMREDSPVRRALDRGLGTLDGVMAGLLASPDSPPPTRPPREPATDVAQQPEQIAEVAEAILEEEPAVGERADPDLDVAEVQAQLRAKHLIEEREQVQQLKRRERR